MDTHLEDIPLLDEGRHQQVDVVRLVEVVAHAVRQGSDGVVQDQKVLVLILVEREHQSLQDEAQVGDQLCTCLFLKNDCKIHFLLKIHLGDNFTNQIYNIRYHWNMTYLERGESGAGGLLNPLVAVEDPLEKF